ncbi:class I SAM-dependent methyltransferase [Nonomuraea sp. NN258]|uniref:methyltransferase n=1 Tax=Nonomuraea antri TaxID=2730852 RepID=UPI001569F230|nr:class I SAM-dependent methyltransferase [Nonomuraea antri]NRQ33042.1 class I SAM-dependent methyltransferase [Nonomuraea antri]
MIQWTETGQERSAAWRTALGAPPPARVVIADDTTKAATAYRLACAGTGLLYRGDFQNAKQLLRGMARRCRPAGPGADFHRHRLAQSQRARTLGMLLIPYDAGHTIPLSRAPDVRQACLEAYGPATEPAVGQLRELLGVIGAHEWRKKGVYVPALHARIHPHHGVFSPIRGEYVDLVAAAPLPGDRLAYDVGTGTGVLAAVLARRGVRRIVATDLDERAVACAAENVERLGLAGRVAVMRADLFPPGRAALVVCNPPWLPATPSSLIDRAVYDPVGRVLRGFIGGLADHLEPGGEGWLILSDLAERLGLRTRGELTSAFAHAGLRVVDRLDTRPRHPKADDPGDPLRAARTAEVTSLWRLRR